jgi:hypothetical protein
MNVLVFAVLLVPWLLAADRPDLGPVTALKIFTLWCMAFLPSWLYLRFLGQRAGAIWDEYVLNLHRLALDEPRFLPKPPSTSTYRHEWVADGGPAEDPERNIYREKFNAYYGRSIADAADNTAEMQDYRVRVDALFPVFLAVVVFSVGWVAVLWDHAALVAPQTLWDVLKYGFLGSYVFIVQMLLRRFFASDLRPSAYASAILRVLTTVISVAVACLVIETWFTTIAGNRAAESAIAFMLGFLPLVAMRFIIKITTAPMRIMTRSLESDYPLYQLDGLNVWYEARLAEENIDDMQTLTTANLVDVLLHTRLPVGRLIDWIDQSYLFLHQDRVERGRWEEQRAKKAPVQEKVAVGQPGPRPEGDVRLGTVGAARRRATTMMGSSLKRDTRVGTLNRTVFRNLGIRTATDLLKAFPPGSATTINRGNGLRPSLLDGELVDVLTRVLSEEQGLAPVWNWYDRGVRTRCPVRRPPSFQTCWIARNREQEERSRTLSPRQRVTAVTSMLRLDCPDGCGSPPTSPRAVQWCLQLLMPRAARGGRHNVRHEPS